MYARQSALFGVILTLILSSCTNNEIPSGPNCAETPLDTPTATITDASSCTASDGQVEVAVSGGVPPYTYSFNGGGFQASPVFSGLSAGLYTVDVKDSRGCTSSTEVTVNAVGSTLAASANTTADTECFAPHNGSIAITPSGGTSPYEVKFGNGAFGVATSFTDLAQGDYIVVVKDAANCTVTLSVKVPRGDSGISYSTEIQPIISANCAIPNCHGPGAAQPNFSTYAGVAARAQNIKLRTSNGSMPPVTQPDLTTTQIQLIACWVDDGAKNN